MKATREGSGILGRNWVKEGMPVWYVGLLFHVEVCILQGILRKHNENELEGPKPAVGDMVCRQL